MESKSLSDFQINAKRGPKSVQQFRFAKALFDNQSESEDELELKRGDVLTVLSQNPNDLIGCNGWWLCVNHSDGSTGLAPANRLRLIPFPTATAVEDTRRKSWNAFPNNEYDIPIGQRFGSPIGQKLCPKSESLYDIPIGARLPALLSSGSSDDLPDHTVEEGIRLSEENLSEVASEESLSETAFYSIPKCISGLYDIPVNNRRVADDYDCPKPVTPSLDEVFARLSETEIIFFNSFQTLFQNFCFGSEWRSRDCLLTNQRVEELRRLFLSLRDSLSQFLDVFGGCLSSARVHCIDAKITTKLDQLVEQLLVSKSIIDSSIHSLESNHMWTLDRLLKTDSAPPDDCDRLLAVTRGLAEDVKHVLAFIRGNGKIIFKMAAKPPIAPKPQVLRRPLPAPPEEEWEDRDYDELSHDYVCLESKEAILAETPKRPKSANWGKEAAEVTSLLSSAIASMIAEMNSNQDLVPKVSLLNCSKFVVICGQKMVYAFDTRLRSAPDDALHRRVHSLSAALKTFVGSVRIATNCGLPTKDSVLSIRESLISLSLLCNACNN